MKIDAVDAKIDGVETRLTERMNSYHEDTIRLLTKLVETPPIARLG